MRTPAGTSLIPLCALLAVSLPSLTLAALPQSSSVPGGIAVIPLGTVSTNNKPPQAWLGEQQIFVTAEGSRWYAVVGLALDTPAGSQELRVKSGDETKVLNFAVSARQYPEQRITLKDASKVQLSAADEERANREIAVIQGLKRHWRNAPDTDPAFRLPAEGRLGGRFGVRRFFNGEPRSPHSGLDVVVARGTPIKASASGKVLAVDDYFFNGKTVFVDHGNGLISMYCHLDRIDAQPGETVGKGQTLGLSGKTGRATGPHLHWSVVLNGAMVDPELFIAAESSAKKRR